MVLVSYPFPSSPYLMYRNDSGPPPFTKSVRNSVSRVFTTGARAGVEFLYPPTNLNSVLRQRTTARLVLHRSRQSATIQTCVETNSVPHQSMGLSILTNVL